MRNPSVSEFVAQAMDAVLRSQEHQSLFGTQYKAADQLNPAPIHGAGTPSDPYAMPVDKITAKPPVSAKADDSFADDNDAKKKKAKPADSSGSDGDADGDCGSADDQAAKDSKSSDSDSSSADDEDMKSSAAFDVAIDSLLTASAALDNVGMEKTASLSLKLASLVVEAKKKKNEDKKDKEKAAKEKAKEKAAKEKAKKDANAAKDKAAKEKAKEKAAKEKEKEKAAKEKAKSKK